LGASVTELSCYESSRRLPWRSRISIVSCSEITFAEVSSTMIWATGIVLRSGIAVCNSRVQPHSLYSIGRMRDIERDLDSRIRRANQLVGPALIVAMERRFTGGMVVDSLAVAAGLEGLFQSGSDV
jgi:hypothetical protein